MNFLVLGVFSGAAYALIALGFVFLHSVIDAYPLQQGSLALLYSYAFLWLYQRWSNIALALVLTALFAIVLGIVQSVALFERLLHRHFPSLAAGLAIALLINAIAAQYFYHGQPVGYPHSLKPSGRFSLPAGITIDVSKLMVLAISVAVAALMALFFRRTRPGFRMRAIADDATGARLGGIDLRMTIRIAFVMAGLCAATSGVLIGILQTSISPSLGDTLTIQALAATLLAGGRSMAGAIVATIIIAVSQSLAIGYISSGFSELVSYLVIITMLLVRPAGLFGTERLARA